MLYRALFVALLTAAFGFSAPAAAQETRQLTSSTPSYTLGPGDQLNVVVFGETELSGAFSVGPAGGLAFPLIGEVHARGLTTEQLAEALQTRLADGYVLSPRVSVSIVQYRPFFILGEVQNPGTYPFASELTVMSAVATAGGFTYRANRRRVYIRRAGESEERAYELTPSTLIHPGDTIRIGERFF